MYYPLTKLPINLKTDKSQEKFLYSAKFSHCISHVSARAVQLMEKLFDCDFSLQRLWKYNHVINERKSWEWKYMCNSKLDPCGS